MYTEVDLHHLGRPHVICAYERDGVIVDPGPTSCLERLLEGIEGEPRAILLTHIHLDHAGATGDLVRRFPDAEVYVHERGAPHMEDPSRLVSSAARLYGDDMNRLWGPMLPVPAQRINVLYGGETVEGMEVAYTPGHASHHVAYLDRDSGEAFCGDVAGVRIPGTEYTIPPTPPPDIDVEAWGESLAVVEQWAPQSLCLTHFGHFTDVSAQLERMREALADRAARSHDMTAEQFGEWSAAEVHARFDDEIADALIQAAPPDQLGLGLRRYWDKRAAA